MSGPRSGRFCSIKQDHGIEKSLDVTTLLDLCEPAIQRGEKSHRRTSHPERQPGHRHDHELRSDEEGTGPRACPPTPFRLHFKGSAGQSFGAFMTRGMTFSIEGDANDYVGKDFPAQDHHLPSPAATFKAEENMIMATSRSTAPRPGKFISAAWRASASACATAASTRWSRALATTVAST